MFSWIADGSKQEFSVKTSSTTLHDVLIQALALRNIDADSGLNFSLILFVVFFLDFLFFPTLQCFRAGDWLA